MFTSHIDNLYGAIIILLVPFFGSTENLNKIISPYLQGTHSKTPSGCLKPKMLPNLYNRFPTHSHTHTHTHTHTHMR
jgi:hypothetical protein